MNLKHQLVEKAKQLEPILRIGKSGITEGVINEIKIQLKQNKLIKIKLLRPALANKDRKELAKEIAQKTDSELIHQVGFVIVLYKK
ncbi:YhbY family RNA-binding protein [Candidatus Woesearchaeota archaeon]|nr:YhbY family RNA-binding protein [Candidatus Woesearchaeota archaeon]